MESRKNTALIVIVIAVTVVAAGEVCADRQITNLSPGYAEFKTDQVCIRVKIRSNIYIYEVTNLGTSAIDGFEVKQHVAYNFKGPDGWEGEIYPDTFRAKTNNPKTAIGPNMTAEFSMRVSSKGAVLGLGSAKLHLKSGRNVTVPNLWVSVPEPKSYVVLVAGSIGFILLLHTAILTYNRRRRSEDRSPKTDL